MDYNSRLEAFNQALEGAKTHTDAIEDLITKAKDPQVNPQALAEQAVGTVAGTITATAGGFVGIQHFSKFKEFGNKIMDAIDEGKAPINLGQKNVANVVNDNTPHAIADDGGNAPQAGLDPEYGSLSRSFTRRAARQARLKNILEGKEEEGQPAPAPAEGQPAPAPPQGGGQPAPAPPEPEDLLDASQNVMAENLRLRSDLSNIDQDNIAKLTNVGNSDTAESIPQNVAHIGANQGAPAPAQAQAPNNAGAVAENPATEEALAGATEGTEATEGLLGGLGALGEGASAVLGVASAAMPWVGAIAGVVGLGAEIASLATPKTKPAPPPPKVVQNTTASIGANLSSDHLGSLGGMGLY
jgi:hypothetical protein